MCLCGSYGFGSFVYPQSEATRCAVSATDQLFVYVFVCYILIITFSWSGFECVGVLMGVSVWVLCDWFVC